MKHTWKRHSINMDTAAVSVPDAAPHTFEAMPDTGSLTFARCLLELLEEVVTLIVNNDEGGEVLDVDLPHGLHTELLHIKDLDLLDGVLREDSRGATNGAQVEALVLLASFGDLLGAVTLGEHDEATARLLELINEGVHAASGGRAKGARGEAVGLLGGAGVVNDVVLEVLRHRAAILEALLDLSVGDIAGDDDGAGEGEAGLDGVLGELGAEVSHGHVEVNLDGGGGEELVLGHLGHVLGGVRLEALEEDTVLGDLTHRLAIGGA